MFRVELWMPEANLLLRNLTHTASVSEAMQSCVLHRGEPLVWEMEQVGVWSARSAVFEYRIVALTASAPRVLGPREDREGRCGGTPRSPREVCGPGRAVPVHQRVSIRL